MSYDAKKEQQTTTIEEMADFREAYIQARHDECLALGRGAYKRFQVLFEEQHPNVMRTPQ